MPVQCGAEANVTHPREHGLGDVLISADERRVASVFSLAESAQQRQQGAAVTAVTLVFQGRNLQDVF